VPELKHFVSRRFETTAGWRLEPRLLLEM